MLQSRGRDPASHSIHLAPAGGPWLPKLKKSSTRAAPARPPPTRGRAGRAPGRSRHRIGAADLAGRHGCVQPRAGRGRQAVRKPGPRRPVAGADRPQFTGARADMVRDAVEGTVGQAASAPPTPGTSSLKVFDRVQRALVQIGVPGRDDLNYADRARRTPDRRTAQGQRDPQRRPARPPRANRRRRSPSCAKAPAKKAAKRATKATPAPPLNKPLKSRRSTLRMLPPLRFPDWRAFSLHDVAPRPAFAVVRTIVPGIPACPSHRMAPCFPVDRTDRLRGPASRWLLPRLRARGDQRQPGSSYLSSLRWRDFTRLVVQAMKAAATHWCCGSARPRRRRSHRRCRHPAATTRRPTSACSAASTAAGSVVGTRGHHGAQQGPPGARVPLSAIVVSPVVLTTRRAGWQAASRSS